MYYFDVENLTINKQSLPNSNKETININVLGDWGPKLGGNSDITIEKRETFYTDLSSFFYNADLNIVNLETVIDTSIRDFQKGAIKLIDKPEVLNSLKSININLACLANNHIMDNGIQGLINTINHLDNFNIDYVGAGLKLQDIYRPYLLNKYGNKIAIINTAEGEEANEKYNNHIGASDIECYKIIDQIRKCKEQGYFTIIIAHAGVEYLPSPPPFIQEIYRNFVIEGADFVIGHHPHVPQGFEIFNNVPIFYSLGNFGMWKKYWKKNCYHSFFLNISISENSVIKVKIIPYKINKDKITSIDISKYRDKIIKLNENINNIHLLWHEYIKQYSLKDRYLQELLSVFYNSEFHQNNQVNYHTTLSKKHIHLSTYKKCLLKNKKFTHELDIPKKDSFFLNFENILYPLYKAFIFVKKIAAKIKNLFK